MLLIKFFIALTSLSSFFIVSGNFSANVEDKFILGNENLLRQYSHLIRGKNLALITNSTGVLKDGTHLIDILSVDYKLQKVFTPEHGLRGNDFNENYTDEKTGVYVVSLYGNNKKPAIEDLSGIDVMIYDIQDVGARFYTFINTMYYCMEACAETGKQIIICDRPLIQYGNYVDGFVLEDEYQSFVGLLNIPVAYGMTCGELAGFINAEYLESKCNLTVIKMENYNRDFDYDSLKLPWIKPSPNLYFPSSAVAYPGTCLFEGTNFSEGRGTDKPFEYVGAPYCDGDLLASEMNSFGLEGVNFQSINFIPSAISSPSNPPKYVGEKCGGVFINVTDNNKFESVKTGIFLIYTINKLYPEFEIKKNNFLDKLAGTDDLRIMINNKNSPFEIIQSYSNNLELFKTKRIKYLLYG